MAINACSIIQNRIFFSVECLLFKELEMLFLVKLECIILQNVVLILNFN